MSLRRIIAVAALAGAAFAGNLALSAPAGATTSQQASPTWMCYPGTYWC